MTRSHAPEIRDLLRESPDGLTCSEIKQRLPKISSDDTIRNCLERMPDAYIDRWADPVRGQWQAVWCVVVPPEDCPYPTERFKS